VARAQLATDLAIVTHSTTSEIGLDQLELFEDEGVDPARVAIGHADSHPVLAYHLALIERGASLIFDGVVGQPFRPAGWEDRIVRLTLELIDRGHADRLMLSHDLSVLEQLTPFGGTGLTNVAAAFLPRLRDAGVPEPVIRQLTVDNPRRLLTVPARD
jgi:phosphotriesterase-related protein